MTINGNDILAGDEITIRARVVRNDADTLIELRGSLDSMGIRGHVQIFIPWDDIQTHHKNIFVHEAAQMMSEMKS